MKINLTAEQKLILISFGPVVAGIFLFVLLLNPAFGQIKDIRTKLDEAKNIEKILIQKKNIIDSVTDDILSQTNAVTIALPKENSSLLASSQVKKYAFENNMTITSVKTSSELKLNEGIKKAGVTFEMSGPKEIIYQLLDFLEKMLPLVKLGKIELSGNNEQTNASVTMETFWSDLPSKLPTLTDKATELSEDDIELIVKLASYKLPVFFEIPANPANENPNPFGI